jgi:O-antigen ligase
MAARADSSVRALQASLLALALMVGWLAGIEPRLAVVLVFGIGFAVLTVMNLTAGLCLFAVLTFLDSVISSSALSVTKLMGTLLVVSWLAKLVTDDDERDQPSFNHPILLYVIALLTGWTAVSVLWADQAGPVVENIYRLVPNAMLFLVVFSAVRERKQVLWVIGCFVVAALLAAAYGLAVPTDPSASDRLSGAVGNANETAAALVAGAVLAGALAAALENPLMRLAAAIGVPICVFGIFLTLSRGGLVALAAALVAAIVMAGRWRGIVLAVVGTLCVTGLVYFAVIASPAAKDRLLAADGGSGRTDIWKVGWRMVEAEPVRGIGAGNFPNTSVHYLLEPGALVRDDFIVDEPKVAHNMYLEMLAELGVVGLALFGGVLVFSLWCAARAARTFMRAGDTQLEIISRAMFVALVGILASDIFGSRQFSKQLWLLMALTPALLAIARKEQAGAAQPVEVEPAVSGPGAAELPRASVVPA